jgi:hypothetical protein
MLAKLRDAWASPLDETRAWACLTTNLLGLPGLGSLLGRRLWAATGQLALSLGGALVSVWWLWGVFAYWREAGELPPPSLDVLWGLLGLGLFGLGWLWSLVTSLFLIREGRRNEAAQPSRRLS